MVLLSVESENGAVLTYRLAKTQITVGSSSKNDVVVRSPGLAERHLVIHHNGDVFTFVTADRQTVVLNGERRARGVLNPGDKLRMGAINLVFRGTEAGVELVEESPRRPTPVAAPPSRDAGESVSFRSDPSGFAEARTRLVELFLRPRVDRLQQLIAVLREALPDAEVAILAPGEGDAPVALASVWTGELPKLPRRAMVELSTPGRYAILEGAGPAAAVPVVTAQREIVAILVARPVGALGDESIGLLGEAARFLALHWRDVEREDNAFTGWEMEARHRLDALLPGSSQAVQVLRSGILDAARGHEPVLICGADGTGRTEVARILATLGPVAGHTVTVFEGKDSALEVLRQELFGPSGRPTLGSDLGGVLGRARGGVLLIRHVDRLPAPLQSEVAALISAQGREMLSSHSIRWVVTCGEDPLALVQQGCLASTLFMAFSQRLLRVPRLSERREDLPLLIAALMRRSAGGQQKNIRGITVECLNTLLASRFPGEIGELVGEVNRLVAATPDGEMVRCDSMGPGFNDGGGGATGDVAPELLKVLSSDNLKESIPRIEQIVIDRVMRRVKGNQSKAARTLGISRGALIAKLKEYGVPDFRYLRRRRGGVG